jgi:predicted permease
MARSSDDQKVRLKPHLWMIRLIGVIVPRRFRARWHQEWAAELEYREELLARWDKLNWQNKLELLWRSLGAFLDALWLQRQRLEEDMFQDLRFGLRMLLKHKGFTAVAVLTLALGIGANTAVFSLVDGILWRPLAAAQAERLVAVYTTGGNGSGYRSVSYADYAYYRDQQKSLSGLAAYARVPLRLRNGSQIEQIGSELVTGNFFQVLGLQAAQGRMFNPADDQTRGAHPVVVISHRMWRERFNQAPQAVGQTLNLNGQDYSIIGVAPAQFSSVVLDWGKQPDVWLPMMMQPQVMPIHDGVDVLQNRDARWLLLVGRLRDGVELAQAEAELKVLAAQLTAAWPQHNAGRQALVLPQRQARFWPEYRQEIVRVLTMLQVLVVMALLVACFNVANLLLARAAARQKETGIRLALGAGPWRLLRQWLTESLLLALLAAGGGLLFAQWLMSLFAVFPLPFKIALAIEPRLDARVLGFTLLAAVATSLLFSLALAWQTARVDLLNAIKESLPGRPGKSIASSGLVIAQIALSLALLAGAGLLARSLWNLRNIETGYRIDRVLLAQFDLDPREFTSERGLGFYQQLLDRVRALPGVETASLTKNVPINPLRMKKPPIAAEGADSQREEDWLNAEPDFISPGYFETLGIRLLAGRDFDGRDAIQAPRVVIVNQTLAERLWPHQSAVGERMKIAGEQQPYTVIAVAPNLKYRALTESPPPYYYLPLAQNYLREMTLQVRTTTQPLALATALRQTAREIDASAFIREISTLDGQVAQALSQPSLTALSAGLLALLALALAATGLYSVMAYSVIRRTREIGIRLALGAQTQDVLQLVLKQGLSLALAGVGAGLLIALALLRMMRGLLFGVNATDPLTLVVVALLLLMVALLSCWIPARRAAKVDPMLALRHD